MTTTEANDLAGLASEGLNDVPEFESGATQDRIPETETTKVSFRGVNYDPLTEEEDYKIGDEVSFIVKGRVIEVGDRQLRDRGEQHFAKIDVSSVVPTERH